MKNHSPLPPGSPSRVAPPSRPQSSRSLPCDASAILRLLSRGGSGFRAGALGAMLLALASCGGSEATSEEPAAEQAATASATSMAGARGGAAAFDPNAPEYQGDHSLTGDPTAGAAVYQANCVACHAADGRANGGVTGADLVGDPRRLAKNNDTLLRAIRDGVLDASPAMPPHRDILTDEQICDALAYVRSTFGGTQE
ncbi:MAG: cytochrome c [Myxococcales bacterium]|nr:cytochrome c [Myxococcales bacterium]